MQRASEVTTIWRFINYLLLQCVLLVG